MKVFGFLDTSLVSNLVGTRVDTRKWIWTHYFKSLPRQAIDTVRFQTCLIDYVCSHRNSLFGAPFSKSVSAYFIVSSVAKALVIRSLLK